MKYEINNPISAKQIADLRESVGWNRMEESYKDLKMTNLFHIACYENDLLIGYVCVVSNNVTDAYIQDLMVHPSYQNKGIGTSLMNQTISKIKEMKIYMISVIYGEEPLRKFYEKFGFVSRTNDELGAGMILKV